MPMNTRVSATSLPSSMPAETVTRGLSEGGAADPELPELPPSEPACPTGAVTPPTPPAGAGATEPPVPAMAAPPDDGAAPLPAAPSVPADPDGAAGGAGSRAPQAHSTAAANDPAKKTRISAKRPIRNEWRGQPGFLKRDESV